MSKGPLAGVRIIEIAAIGPGPMACTLLADMGADVIRIDRTVPSAMDMFDRKFDVMGRSRRSIAIDLSKPDGLALAMRLIETADGLVEGFRPGVAERIGIGPDACLERNPRLVYGRMTGWGQDGPLAKRAGHDLNYLAITGALHAMGRAGDPPAPPLNLVADGSGSLLLAFGMTCGIIEATKSGRGQVVDASMLDSVGFMFAAILAMAEAGHWSPQRESNLVDGGAPFYDCYATSDGHYVSLAAVEPQFYAEFIRKIGWDLTELPEQNDKRHWPDMKARLTTLFASRTRDQWCELLDSGDTCFAPVLTVAEALEAPQAVARGSHVRVGGVVQPSPAPRFSRSGSTPPADPPARGRDTLTVLRDLGVAEDDILRFREDGVVA